MEANCMNKTNTIITRLNSARAGGHGAKSGVTHPFSRDSAARTCDCSSRAGSRYSR